MELYSRTGDDGTTGLLYGGRVPKDSARIAATGAVDEAQAVLGLARAEVERGSELDDLLVSGERDLYVLMSELATAADNRRKLVGGKTLVTSEMVAELERVVDGIAARFEMPHEFVIPGQNRVSALLDQARTVVRRAERLCIGVAEPESQIVPYLNRLSTLLWAMARWQEGGEALASRSVPR
jgi:cob(I)alamin adenosyltransferase